MASQIPSDSEKQIASFLLGYGLLNDEQLSHATASSSESGKGILETLIEFGFVNESKITDAVGDAYDLDVVHLSQADLNKTSLSLLPVEFILKNRIIPFYIKDNLLKVAISEPSSLNLIGSVRLLTDKSVRAYIVPISEMNAILNGMEHEAIGNGARTKTIVENGPKSDVKDTEARSSVVIDFVNTVLNEAIKQGGSDIHLEPYKSFARIRYRVDGVLQDQAKHDSDLFDHYAAIVTRIKIMSSLDIAERRLPQDGAISLDMGDHEVDLRVSILPTSFGERVVMRILDRSSISLTLETLGFMDDDEAAFKAAVDAPQGMVLVTGPTGSGKSTTLYAALSRVNREDINILTAEDPVEYGIDGVGQVQIKEDIGLTFSAALRSFLRQDPEVILVGEIRDKETVDIAVKSALTGHLVLSTLHTNDAVSTISRMLNMGVAPYLLTSSLTLIVAQRLARKICQNCKTDDDSPSESELLAVGFTLEEASRVRLYHGTGCTRCHNTGYKGRQGIYEVLRITDDIKNGILNNLTSPELLKLAQDKQGFSTMQDIGRGMLIQGLITLEEYQRVLLM